MKILASPASSRRRLEWLLAFGFVVLIGVTWRLWIPQIRYPQIPLTSIGIGAFPLFEWSAFIVLLVSLGFTGFGRSNIHRCGNLVTVACLIGLIWIDQHRLQPWVLQFLIVSIILALADDSTMVWAWRAVVIGIYAWSAWSKIDYGFFIEHGPFLIDGVCKSIGMQEGIRAWPANRRFAISVAIPLFELAIAIGLCLSKTRRFSLFFAVCMHVGLLLALGPLGHNHQPGVLVWNLFFIAQNWFLFGNSAVQRLREPESVPDISDRAERRICRVKVEFVKHVGNQICWSIVALALVWPILEPFGYCDHWAAWAVYAARPERVTIFVHEEDVSHLPEKMKRYLGPQIVFDEWYPLRTDRWSLDAVYAPIYPQDRFQVGVALGFVRDFDLHHLRIVIEGPANRWSGAREVCEYVGIDSVRRLADSFLLGARPREVRVRD